MTEPKSRKTDIKLQIKILVDTLTDARIAEIKQAFDLLEPDDTTNDVPSSTLTVDQWITFTQKYAPKRVCDPRRARPI